MRFEILSYGTRQIKIKMPTTNPKNTNNFQGSGICTEISKSDMPYVLALIISLIVAIIPVLLLAPLYIKYENETGILSWVYVILLFAFSTLDLLISAYSFYLVIKWLDHSRDYGSVKFELSENGLSIEKLGIFPWDNVISLEPIPDCDNKIILHTTKNCRLSLGMKAAVLDAFTSSFNYWMSKKQNAPSPGEKQYQVMAIYAPGYIIAIILTWISIGACFVFLAAYKKEIHHINIIFATFIAGLLWIILAMPIQWGIGIFGHKKIRNIYIKSNSLYSSHGDIQFDLNTTDSNRFKFGDFFIQLEVLVLSRYGTYKYFIGDKDTLDELHSIIKDAGRH